MPRVTEASRSQWRHRTKNDGAAQILFGPDAYRRIPKSVFALVAFYLAMRCSDGEDPTKVKSTLLAEIDYLAEGSLITPSQQRNAHRALMI